MYNSFGILRVSNSNLLNDDNIKCEKKAHIMCFLLQRKFEENQNFRRSSSHLIYCSWFLIIPWLTTIRNQQQATVNLNSNGVEVTSNPRPTRPAGSELDRKRLLS